MDLILRWNNFNFKQLNNFDQHALLERNINVNVIRICDEHSFKLPLEISLFTGIENLLT